MKFDCVQVASLTFVGALVAPNTLQIRTEALKAFSTMQNVKWEKHKPSDILNFPQNQTLYVIADLHGDFLAAVSLLYGGNIIDRNGRWAGENALLVQLGDIADRGPDSPSIYELFWRLGAEARAAGGQVINLFGNHEVMNLMGQTHYVATEELRRYFSGNFEKCRNVWNPSIGYLGKRVLNTFRVTQRIGDLMFVHAGLLAEFATINSTDLDELLKEAVLAYVGGRIEEYKSINSIIENPMSPVWTRELTHDKNIEDRCKQVLKVLKETNSSRMFVGHTPTHSKRVETYCNHTFIQADTGNSRWMLNSQTLIRIQTTLRQRIDDIDIYDRTFDEFHLTQMPYIPDNKKNKKGEHEKTLNLSVQTLFFDVICYQGSAQIKCQDPINKNDEL